MATNDDIVVKGNVPAYLNDTLRLFYAELQKGETDYAAGVLIRLAVIIDSKAHADERAKIVKHLNALIKERNPNDKYGRQLIERIIEEIEEDD
jgi:hypothetical protein